MNIQSRQTFWEQVVRAARTAGKWVEENQDAIRALGTWGTVNSACLDARLYVPFDPKAWIHISALVHGQESDGAPDYEAIITATYGARGLGANALRKELLGAPLLRERRDDVGEVLESLADGRNYVSICGTLPLIEYVISRAAGKWNHPHKHVKSLERRLRDDDVDQAILLDFTAVEMIRSEIPNVWKVDVPHRVGAVVADLNRQYVLHGSAVGWNGPTNATRATLLLAAVARVAEPLFKPRASLPVPASLGAAPRSKQSR